MFILMLLSAAIHLLIWLVISKQIERGMSGTRYVWFPYAGMAIFLVISWSTSVLWLAYHGL